MTQPRAHLIDQSQSGCYHLVSRCVRRSFLCGFDPLTQTSYEHRKAWIEHKIFQLAQAYAVDILAYAIMGNHYHLIVHHNPKNSWSNHLVAKRWVNAHPPYRNGQLRTDLIPQKIQQLLDNPLLIKRRRQRLLSLSDFMWDLNGAIARMANAEDQCTGAFFERRFRSGSLIDHDSTVSAMAYVDLNPVRAHIVNNFHNTTHTAIAKRLHDLRLNPQLEHQPLAPVVSGTDTPFNLNINLHDYCQILNSLQNPIPDPPANQWQRRLAVIAKPQLAYGRADALRRWALRFARHRLRAQPLPD